jgi:LPXTG-motif cell wall-anchored protein
VTNTGSIAAVFQLFVDAKAVGLPTDPIAPGDSKTFTGSLASSTDVVSATVTANGTSDFVTLMPGSGTPDTSSCVLGETLTNPTVKPTTPIGVLPVTISKPQAAPPTATLPFTGIPTSEIALVALGLLGMGGGLLYGTRRRARHLMR